MAGADLEQFEAEMLADPQLAHAVRQHRTAWEIGELLAEERLRAQIRERFAGSSSPSDINDPVPTKWKHGLFAVLLLLIVIAGFFIFRREGTLSTTPSQKSLMPEAVPDTSPSKRIDPEHEPSKPPAVPPIAHTPKQSTLRTLALATYQTPEGLTGTRGAEGDEALSRAIQAFQRRNYARAIQLLQSLPENDTQEALALRAHAHFLAGHFAAAAQDFDALERGGIYRREARWFGILARLAWHPTEKQQALRELESLIQDATHPYQAEAEKLKMRIEKL
ncbi:MAG TPA: hypothetical protein PKD78_14910 [Saprospiraceae bacterium]|nr:hypothetical protein [Saprospiraceae bacterium]